MSATLRSLRSDKGHVLERPKLHLFDETALGLTTYRGAVSSYGLPLVEVIDPLGLSRELDSQRAARVGGWDDRPFDWGSCTPSARLLSLAILLDVTCDESLSLSLADAFLWSHVYRWAEEWEITAADVAAWAAVARGGEGGAA